MLFLKYGEVKLKKAALIISILFCLSFNLFAQNRPDTIQIAKNMYAVKLTDNVYEYTFFMPEIDNYPANGMLYINGGKVLVIDTPGHDSTSYKLIDWIAGYLKAEIEGVVITHWHKADRIGGLNAFHEKGIKSYALDLTISIAKDKKLPVPQIGFKDSLELNLNGKKVICKYFGAGHTADNIVVWLPEENVLFGGCLIKSLAAADLGNLKDINVTAWPNTVQKVMDEYGSAKIIIPGHLDYGDKQLLTHTIELARSLKK